MDEYIVYEEAARGLKLTKSGKALWVGLPNKERVLVPISQISAKSQVQEEGDIGSLIVTKWWADQQVIILPGSNTNPDNRLRLISDQTGEEIRLHKFKCVWCGLKNFAHTVRCYHCLRNFRTGELTGEGEISDPPPFIDPHPANRDYHGKD